MKIRSAWFLVCSMALAMGCGREQAQAVAASPSGSPGDDGDLGADAATDDDASSDDPSLDPPDADPDDGIAVVEASSGSQADAGPPCTRPLALGDLVIDEIMIASLKGSGDHGEWLEVASTLDCAIDLRGLHGECPRGAKVSTLDVIDDVWIPARGSFVIADSSDPAVTHYIPGVVVVWNGDIGDVLRNEGTTVSILMDGTLIDSVTYPSLPATIGAALAFPSDCPATARATWTHWRTATWSWFPGFLGTPNAPNSDVVCASGP